MDDLRKIIEKDVIEKQLLREGLKIVKVRQTVTICILILIFIMFSLNFFQAREQIMTMKDVVSVANAIIKAQDETIDSLMAVDSLYK